MQGGANVFISMGSTVVCEQACSQVERASISTARKCRSPKLNEEFRERRIMDGCHLTFPYIVKIEGQRKMKNIKTTPVGPENLRRPIMLKICFRTAILR